LDRVNKSECSVGEQCILGSCQIVSGNFYSTNEDTSINITLTSSITGNWARITSPAHGTAQNKSSLTNVNFINITYTPSANYNGEDYFIYNVSDGTNVEVIRVNITINASDDAPVLTVGNIVFGVEDSTPVEKSYIIPVTEVDGDSLIYSSSNLPYGAVLDSATGELKWSVSTVNIGIYNITFTVTDNTSAKLNSTKTVNITVRQAIIYYCDPLNGNTTTGDGSASNPWGTVESVIAEGKFNGVIIKSGDIVKLRAGFHGIFNLYNGAPSGTIKKNTDYITIEADTGAVANVSFIWLYNCKYWHFKGLRVSPSFSNQVTKDAKSATGGYIVRDISGSSHIIIEDCNIFTTLANISAWDAWDWHDLAYTGISMPYPNYLTIHGNFIHNVADGITAGGSDTNPGTNLLIEQNMIDSFGDDGIQITSPNSIIQDNIITNVYRQVWFIKNTTTGELEYTHSDGMQINELDYPAVHNVIIRRNYINARTDPNRDPNFTTLNNHALQATFLDGLVDSVIENNVFMGGHYTRGISINTYADNVSVINNTLERSYGFPTNARPVISLPVGSAVNHKWGARNVIVRNNIAYGFPLDSNNLTSHPYSDYYENVVVDNNFDIDSIVSYDPNVEFVDYFHGDMRPLITSPMCNGSINPVGVAVGALPCVCTNDLQCEEVFGVGATCDINTGKCVGGTGMGSLSPFTQLLNFLKGLLTRETGNAILTGNAVNETNENAESKIPYIILSLLIGIILIIAVMIVKIKKRKKRKKRFRKK